MNLSEVFSGTPKLLDHCLELMKRHSDYQQVLIPKTAPATPAKYASHPDVQFFSSIKAKNHYAYHASKRNKQGETYKEYTNKRRKSQFAPYSRDALLARLRSFNAFNWDVPYLGHNDDDLNDDLTELFCASYGWSCVSVSKSNRRRNLLACCGCEARLWIRFNSLDSQPAGAPCSFNVKEIQQLNASLKKSYVEQIRCTGHMLSCSWKNFPSPLKGTYYLPCYVSYANNILINRYLCILKRLYENSNQLQTIISSFPLLSPGSNDYRRDAFIRVSKMWLLNRFFPDSKENMAVALEKTCPEWLYFLASLGWDIERDQMGSKSVIYLVCRECNRKVLPHEDKTHTQTINDPHVHDQMLGVNKKSAWLETANTGEHLTHKAWCSYLSRMGTQEFGQYFIDLLISSERNIGPKGQYHEINDDLLDFNVNDLQKVKPDYDIDEGLKKLADLQKIYFSD